MCRQWVLHQPPILLRWPRDPSGSGKALRILGRHPCPLGAVTSGHCSLVVSDSLQPHGLYLARLLSPWNFPGKNTGLGCHFLLQEIFPTQGSNPHLLCLLHWQMDSLPLVPSGNRLSYVYTVEYYTAVKINDS